MVRIAIAGGSGNVAQEIIDVLVATKKHEILLLSRKESPKDKNTAGVTWIKADYEDPKQLAQIFKGVHTVLSFVAVSPDAAGTTIQKNLIDASIEAGVKRFAPSEWASSGIEHLSWYAFKAEARQYLKELNKDKKVLEYTLFQPGMFINYATCPYPSSKHVHAMETPFDLNNRRFLVLDGGENDRVSFTTVQDLANVVARAVDYEGEWPVVGGIRGTDLTVGELIALGEKVRGGKPFAVERLKASELEANTFQASWIPKLDHPSIPAELVDMFSRVIVAGILLSFHAEAWHVSDEWNQLLPDYKFTQAEEFLTEHWRGKP
ncbi:hypothetical protein MMC25_000518 [Agyrium rufum]|nr:hypothetical protein [Agyrium rufum]